MKRFVGIALIVGFIFAWLGLFNTLRIGASTRHQAALQGLQGVTRAHEGKVLTDETRPVAYYHLVARQTVDVAIRAALAKKADVLAYVAQQLLEGARCAG